MLHRPFKHLSCRSDPAVGYGCIYSWLCKDVGKFLETPQRLDTEAKHPEEMNQEYVSSQGMN